MRFVGLCGKKKEENEFETKRNQPEEHEPYPSPNKSLLLLPPLAFIRFLRFISTFTMAYYGGASLALLIALSSCAFVAAAGDVASIRFESCGG